MIKRGLLLEMVENKQKIRRGYDGENNS